MGRLVEEEAMGAGVNGFSESWWSWSCGISGAGISIDEDRDKEHEEEQQEELTDPFIWWSCGEEDGLNGRLLVDEDAV